MERSKTNIDITRPKFNREQTNLNFNQAGDQTGRSSRLKAQRQVASVQDAKSIQIYSLYNKLNKDETSQSSASTSTVEGSRRGAKSSSTLYSNNQTTKGTYLLNYQAPLVSARLPKSLFGQPIGIDDMNQLREVVRSKSKNNIQRQRDYDKLTQQFINEIEATEILSKKSNWLNKHKFINTNSYYSALKIYFPLIKQNKECRVQTSKYINMQQKRQLAEDCKYYK